MIIGTGIDIVGLERIGRIVQGERSASFLRRILTDQELAAAEAKQARFPRYVAFIAGRWAVKEAVAKAIGCGIGGMIGFRDIEVLSDLQGKPVCRVSQSAWERLGIEFPYRLHVSISHADGWATAMAIVEDS